MGKASRLPGVSGDHRSERPDGHAGFFGYRWAFRCSTEASSDTILGHGWADNGYSATEIDPQARGVSWLRTEDGIPRRVKAAFLSDEQIIHLASWAAQARAIHHHDDHKDSGPNVIRLCREGDAA